MLLYSFLSLSALLYFSPMMNSFDHVIKYAHGTRESSSMSMQAMKIDRTYLDKIQQLLDNNRELFD